MALTPGFCARRWEECISPKQKHKGEMYLLESTVGNQSTQSTIKEGENPMPSQEIRDLLKKIDEYKQIIDDAENALDAAIADLEEALEEENPEE